MRRLIILVGLSLVLCFAFGQVAYAEFADMDQAANYEWEAIQDLNELGIILGYPGGEFKPQADGTRGDAAMIVYLALRYLESTIPSINGLINAEEAKAFIQEALDNADYATNTALGDIADEIYTAIQDLEIAFRDDLDAMDLRVTTLEERADALEIQVNDLDGAVSDLQVADEDLNASISDLQVADEDLNASISDLQVADEDQNFSISDLQVADEDLNASISDLQVANEELNASISTLQSGLSSAQAAVEAANAQAKQAKNLSILGIILGVLFGIIF